MDKMKFLNDHVALAPLVFEEAPAAKIVKGLDMSSRLAPTLVATKVMADSKSFLKGQTVFLSNEIRNNRLIQIKYELNGEVFIVLPENVVMAVKGISDNV